MEEEEARAAAVAVVVAVAVAVEVATEMAEAMALRSANLKVIVIAGLFLWACLIKRTSLQSCLQ